MTAFRSLAELDLDLQFEDDQTLSNNYTDNEKADILKDLQGSQCEQLFHELMHDLDSPNFSSITLGGLVSVKLPADQSKPDRYSPRALAILRPYLVARTVTRTR